ncbi:MAG TPA: hypothetical protein VEX70_04275 [Pyrinomonadaceae bacterium]|nr:hypothetical protein [Pyrinomonadaceae bacterium]
MNHQIKYPAVLLCLILLLTAACKTTGSSSGKDGIGTSSGGVSLPGGGTAPAVISESDKPLDAMTRAMRAQLDAKSYRAHVTTTLADGAPSKMLIEYVAPDSYRMTQSGQGDAAGGSSMEYVIVKGAMYMKTPKGEWAKSPIDASSMIKAFRDPKMLDELTKTADVKLVGPDMLDGAPMLVYEYTQTNPMGMNLKNTSRTWLSVADGLPRKTESEGEFDGKKTKTLVTMTDYNADIKIESPVK